ncbi:MAG: hypothetical protein VB877_14975, partial [Pirellulaceae bacterium]
MTRLLGLLLVMGMVGCGRSEPTPAGNAVPPSPPESSHTKPEETPVQSRSTVFRAVGKATTFHAANDNGEVEAIGLAGDRATDALLVHLKGLPKLQELWLNRAKITDAGLV